jgi:hypothetical protein
MTFLALHPWLSRDPSRGDAAVERSRGGRSGKRVVDFGLSFLHPLAGETFFNFQDAAA